MVRNRTFLFRKSLEVTSTGACAVAARLVEHSADNGWSISRIPTVDTFLGMR